MLSGVAMATTKYFLQIKKLAWIRLVLPYPDNGPVAYISDKKQVYFARKFCVGYLLKIKIR